MPAHGTSYCSHCGTLLANEGRDRCDACGGLVDPAKLREAREIRERTLAPPTSKVTGTEAPASEDERASSRHIFGGIAFLAAVLAMISLAILGGRSCQQAVSERQRGDEVARLLSSADRALEESDGAGLASALTSLSNVGYQDDVVLAPLRAKASVLVPISHWAQVLEWSPDPSVVSDVWRDKLQVEKFPWRVRHRASGIEMLLVPPGEYMCGASPDDSDAQDTEKPAHQVTITGAFYLGRYEVTQSEWDTAMGSNPSHFQTGGQFPVERVTWSEICGAGGFLERAGGDLRLPTEAEWEYACRAGTTEARYGSAGDVAWFGNHLSASDCTHVVGSKRRNALGLHDTLGNVSEWCSDFYGAYSAEPQVDPVGPSIGSARVQRGGSWLFDAFECRASQRTSRDPDYGDSMSGFRVARTP